MQLDKWSEADLTLPSNFQPLQTLGFAPQQMQRDRVRKFGASILTDESRVRNAVSAVTMAEGESEADAMWIWTRLDPWTLGPLILVNFKWKHHHFNKRNMNSLNTSIAWMPTGVYRSRGPSRYWGFFSASGWLGKWLHSGSRNMRDFSAPVKFFP